MRQERYRALDHATHFIAAGAQIESGKIELEGRDLLALSERDMCQVRGRALSMVFQEPMTSLHPLVTIGWQMQEAVRIRKRVSRRQARARPWSSSSASACPSPGR